MTEQPITPQPLAPETQKTLEPVKAPETDALAEQQRLVKELISAHGPMYLEGAYQFNPQTGDRVIPSETFKSGISLISEAAGPTELQKYVDQKKKEKSATDTVAQAKALLTGALLLPDELSELTQQIAQTTTIEAATALSAKVVEINTKLQGRDKETQEKARIAKLTRDTRDKARGVYDTFTKAFQALPDGEKPEQISAQLVSTQPEAVNGSITVDAPAPVDKRVVVSVVKDATEKEAAYALQILDQNREKPYNADTLLPSLLKSLGLEGIDPAKVKAAVQTVRPVPAPGRPNDFYGHTESNQSVGQGDTKQQCLVNTDQYGKSDVFIPRPDGQTYVYLSFNAPKQGEPLALTAARVDSRSFMVNKWRSGLVESELKKLMPEPQQA